jgi:hypothetical protein
MKYPSIPEEVTMVPYVTLSLGEHELRIASSRDGVTYWFGNLKEYGKEKEFEFCLFCV